MATSTKTAKDNKKDANVDIKGDLIRNGNKHVPGSFEDITPE